MGDAGGTGKAIVSAVHSKGNVVARLIQNASANVLNAFGREAVSHKVSPIFTDEYPA
jgi:hypothetical protein